MRAEIIFTGNELLAGQVLNTHGKYLSEQLTEMGIEIVLHTTVGDNWGYLRLIFEEALKRSDLIITTGGLGPTEDDLTKETVADLLGKRLIVSDTVSDNACNSFTKRGLKAPRCINKQALIPENAVLLENRKGTAPGLLIEGKQTIVLLPGPPVEMKYVFEHSVIPYLRQRIGVIGTQRSKIFKMTGIAEAFVQDKVKGMGDELGDCDIAYLVNPGEVQLKITVHGDNPSFMKEHMVQVEGIIQEHFGDYIFGKDNERPEVLVGNLLTEKNLSIGLAESCTGGLIGAALTSVPGSSRYFQGGIISYANSVKKKVLGVPENILEKCGAVSEETACYMARGARKALGSDIGLAVTGVAGPDGGTAEKPVGLVYVALYDGGKTICRRYTLPGARKAVRKGVVNVSLNIARQYLTDGVPKMQC